MSVAPPKTAIPASDRAPALDRAAGALSAGAAGSPAPAQAPAPAQTLAHVRILLGTRNGAPWLADQLASFVAQSHDAWSLWVSDDGSRDDTRAILARFDRAHPGRIERILDGPRQGSAANYLHLLCHRDLPPGLVALSDQDDVWLPEKLARAVAALGGRTPVATPRVWAARWMVTDADLANRREGRRWPRGPSFGNALVQNVLSGHSVTLNGAALDLVRAAGPQAVPHHDWWLYQLLAGAGADIVLDPRPALFYRQHAGNVVGSHSRQGAPAARFGLMRGGAFVAWTAANRAALKRVHPLLRPEARALLAALEHAPPGGPGRIAAFRRLGLFRQGRADTLLLHIAAGLGHA